MSFRSRWVPVAAYAVAMAFVESAVVLYLRTLANRLDPFQITPADVPAWVFQTEIAREAATLTMLVTVGWLAGQTWISRSGYFLLAFGIWDIFYYAFLWVLTGWPRSPTDWDVLFLIPLPWWGPVWAPMSIAVLMVLGGTLLGSADQQEEPLRPGRWAWSLAGGGMILALYCFMADTLQVLGAGEEAIRAVRPTWFNWPLFLVALLLMAAPILDAWRRKRNR